MGSFISCPLQPNHRLLLPLQRHSSLFAMSDDSSTSLLIPSVREPDNNIELRSEPNSRGIVSVSHPQWITSEKLEELLQKYGKNLGIDKYDVPARMWLELRQDQMVLRKYHKSMRRRMVIHFELPPTGRSFQISSREIDLTFCGEYIPRDTLRLGIPRKPSGAVILISFEMSHNLPPFRWILDELGFDLIQVYSSTNDLDRIITKTMDWVIHCWVHNMPVVVMLDYRSDSELTLMTLKNLRYYCDQETLDIFAVTRYVSERAAYRKWGATELLEGYQDLYKALNKVLTEMHADAIMFYDKWNKYYDFTNFAFAPIKINDIKWKTTEHYFQAQKFPDLPKLQDLIRDASFPRDAFDLARKCDEWKRPDWESKKDMIMRDALDAKFNQHRRLAFKLLSTGTAQLHEHTAFDRYWGDGGIARDGLDKLGFHLCGVRQFLRESEIERLSAQEFGQKVNIKRRQWKQHSMWRERMMRDIAIVKEYFE